jgi:hypothetical protein
VCAKYLFSYGFVHHDLRSERVGSFQLDGAGSSSVAGGEILSATSDAAGTVHVLSDQPLTLHSFYDVRLC